MTHTQDHHSGEISFTLHRHNRKTMAIKVSPDMSVQVIAPIIADMGKIYSAVSKNAVSINERINFLRQFYPKNPQCLYEDGDSYIYLGRRYRLKIQHSDKVDADTDVAISNECIILSSHHPDNKLLTKELLNRWFIQKAGEHFKERLRVIYSLFPQAYTELVTPTSLALRPLTGSWGIMKTSGRLTLNTRLILTPIESIDYVIAHELCHRIHFNHSKEFWALLASVIPDWVERKKSLDLWSTLLDSEFCVM